MLGRKEKSVGCGRSVGNAVDYFRNLKNFVERETGRKIKCLRSDGEKEYFSGQFNRYLQQMGIQRKFS